MASNGQTALAEIQFADYIFPAFDQVRAFPCVRQCTYLGCLKFGDMRAWQRRAISHGRRVEQRWLHCIYATLLAGASHRDHNYTDAHGRAAHPRVHLIFGGCYRANTDACAWCLC